MGARTTGIPKPPRKKGWFKIPKFVGRRKKSTKDCDNSDLQPTARISIEESRTGSSTLRSQSDLVTAGSNEDKSIKFDERVEFDQTLSSSETNTNAGPRKHENSSEPDEYPDEYSLKEEGAEVVFVYPGEETHSDFLKDAEEVRKGIFLSFQELGFVERTEKSNEKPFVAPKAAQSAFPKTTRKAKSMKDFAAGHQFLSFFMADQDRERKPVEEIYFPTPTGSETGDNEAVNISQLDDFITDDLHINFDHESAVKTNWDGTAGTVKKIAVGEFGVTSRSLPPPTPPPLPNVFSNDSSIDLNPASPFQAHSKANKSAPFTSPVKPVTFTPILVDKDSPSTQEDAFQAIEDFDFGGDDLSAIIPRNSFEASFVEGTSKASIKFPSDSWDSEIVHATDRENGDKEYIRELTANGEVIQSTVDAERLRKAIGNKTSRAHALEERMKRHGIKRSPKRSPSRKSMVSTPTVQPVQRPSSPVPKSVVSQPRAVAVSNEFSEQKAAKTPNGCDASISEDTMEISLQMNSAISVNSDLTSPPSVAATNNLANCTPGDDFLQSITFDTPAQDDNTGEEFGFDCTGAWGSVEQFFKTKSNVPGSNQSVHDVASLASKHAKTLFRSGSKMAQGLFQNATTPVEK